MTVWIIFLILVILALAIIVDYKKDITKFSENEIASPKVSIYLLSEILYNNDLGEKYISGMNNTLKDGVELPIKLIFYNLFYRQIIKIKKHWMLFSAIIVIFLVLIGISAFIQISDNIDIPRLFIFTISLFIIFIYSNSATKSISLYEDNINNLSKYISKLKLVQSEDERKKLLDEMKVDFDLYKVDNSVYLQILPFGLFLIINFSKIEFFTGNIFLIPFLIIISIWNLMSYIYKVYRSEIFYVAYQTLNRYRIDGKVLTEIKGVV